MAELLPELERGRNMASQSLDLGIVYQEAVAPGTYPYMPLRSLPHLRMCEAVKAGARPRCGFHLDGDWVLFDVVAISEPHYLTLDRFQRRAADP